MMCFGAQVWADYRRYVKMFGAKIDIHAFVDLLRRWEEGEKMYLPKGLTDAFKLAQPKSAEEAQCRDLVLAYEAKARERVQADLEKQRQRLEDAKTKLSTKPTKKAAEDERIATKLIGKALAKLADIDRTTHEERDDQIYSSWYCPVLFRESSGQLVVRPMRYLCRPAGMPRDVDTKYPGVYNARRDSLDGAFWRRLYENTHALVVAEAFLEHVNLHDMQGRSLMEGERPTDVILKFAPDHGQLMRLACVYSRWTGPGEDLHSFAIITDDPPPEVASAGHNRCPIVLKPTSIMPWLSAPAPADFDAMLSDHEDLYFGHVQLSAAA